MRFLTKLILVTIALLAGWLLFSKTFEVVKEKYFYKFVANRFHVYAAKKWNADLYVGYVKGSIFKDLSLRNIAVKSIKNLPDGLEVRADSLDFSYPPFGLLFGKFDARFKNLNIIYKDVTIPVDAYQHEGLAVIVIRNNVINLSKFSDALPPGVALRGNISTEGEIILKKLKPHLVNISFSSKDFQLDSGMIHKMKGLFSIEATGKADNPQISGAIKVSRADIDGGLSFVSLFTDLRFRNDFLNRSSMNIDVGGESITTVNKYLNSTLRASLKLKKEGGGRPYFLGDIIVNKGTFKFYENEFRIIRGKISFLSPGRMPQFDIAEEVNAGGYRISAKIEGEGNVRVALSSQPELSYSEIVSLLRFKKQINSLTGPEKDELTGADFSDILINNLFMH